MGTRLISLEMKPSTELPELEDLRTFLGTGLARHLPGFTPIDNDVRWGGVLLSLLGRDASGALIAVFPSVARREGELHEVMAQALLAAAWLEENGDDVARQYQASEVDVARPLRMLLIAPAADTLSRPLSRALARAGLELMRYSIYDIDTGDEVLRGVSFDAAPAAPARDPVAKPPRDAAPGADAQGRKGASPTSSAAAVPAVTAAPSVAAAEAPRDQAPRAQVADPDSPTAPKTSRRNPRETFLLSVSGAMQSMVERVLSFVIERFPDALGEVSGPNAFTLAVNQQHVATVHVDRSSIWLQIGPERIPTNKITDLAMLELVLTLPSVLKTLEGEPRPS